MKNLKRGDVVIYIGEEGEYFTPQGIYEVRKSRHYMYFYDDYEIILIDDEGSDHYISEDFFIKNFQVFK